MEYDSFDIRNEIQGAVERAMLDADGFFSEAQVEPAMRNSFCLRLGPEAPIFTVTVNYGGAMTVRR